MPRGRCHFALLHKFHEVLRKERPEAAELADRHLPDFLAGSGSPDGMRYIGRMGKLATHFYVENRKDTWGKAVSGMFNTHPDLADPGKLPDRDLAIVLGYISHLTVDEAFRDTVTSHVHGIENWRPIIQGLWSLVDELDVGYSRLVSELDEFRRDDCVGFIDCKMVREYLELVRPWNAEKDSWKIEKVFLKLVESDVPLDIAKQNWLRNRDRARPFLDDSRKSEFVERAVSLSLTESLHYLDGYYLR
jgi:hypothetical protein